jgi:hypothetical protein
MNLYVLIAVALGLVAGTAEVPVARPALAGVVARRREARRSAAASPAVRFAVAHPRPARPVHRAMRRAVREVASFSQASSPRPPSIG